MILDMQPYPESFTISRTYLIEILAEAKNFNNTLREWKRVKHAYKLADGTYLFSFISYQPDETCSLIDFDSIAKEARELRRRLQEAKAQNLFKC